MKIALYCLLSAIGALAVLFMISAIVVYSGGYNIAASTGHTRFVHSTLDQLMVRSVRAHADEVVVPSGIDLQDREMAKRAVADYESMCVMCHGAPGVDPDRWSQALYPMPPDLIHAQRENKWSEGEIFWVIKHGIKDTGMAAFGDSHDDADLWALTALVRQFPDLSPDEYASMVQEAKSTNGRHPARAEEQEKHAH